MEMTYVEYSWYIMLFQLLCHFIDGYFIYRLFIYYVRLRQKQICKILLFLAFAVSSGMTIWIGDHNLILTFPVFIITAMLCTDGNRLGRLSVTFTFFCLEMSVCAFLDTYLKSKMCYDVLRFIIYPAAGRVIIFTAVFFSLKRKLPEKIVFLPERLWKIILRLSLMPLSTLIALVSLTYGKYFSHIADTQAMYLGLMILPFIFMTSFAILAAINALADHEQLERSKQLFEMREVYYQNLQQQENSIRHIRHDMKNHLSTIRTLLTGENTEEALSYLDTLLDEVHPSQKDKDHTAVSGLQDVKRFCENDAMNALLQAKVRLLLQNGLDYDFRVQLQEKITISDIDLCSLIGNALDNAIRAAASASDKTITLRCRCDKGVFMLKVENCFRGQVDENLKTTKPDSERHGLGISGMKEITARYRGSLETQVNGDCFTLLAYLCCAPDPA